MAYIKKNIDIFYDKLKILNKFNISEDEKIDDMCEFISDENFNILSIEEKKLLISKLICLYNIDDIDIFNSYTRQNKQKINKDLILSINKITYFRINFFKSNSIDLSMNNKHIKLLKIMRIMFKYDTIITFVNSILSTGLTPSLYKIIMSLYNRLYKLGLLNLLKYPLNSTSQILNFVQKHNFKKITSKQFVEISSIVDDNTLFNILNNTIRLFYTDLNLEAWDYNEKDLVYSEELFELIKNTLN